ncbi:hypothetical protein PMAYCL1PPCAC_22610, partial [Pristionchus mayeri]
KREMKFSAVLFVLIAGCISEIAHTLPAASGGATRARRWAKVKVEVTGFVSCPKEFRARINTWEVDNGDH